MVKDFNSFVRHLKLEAFALAILMVVLTYKSSAPLWILLATFPLFDIGVIGYLKNTKLGATTYNISHSSIVPTLLIVVGIISNTEWISVLGFSWSFHIAVDRALGFGLKHEHSFKETHLGHIGK